MRFLTLAEALIIAEAVTLAHVARVDLLDSALHAPQAGFGGVEFYPDPIDKVAVLAVRIAGNHPLPDGNKRLAWQALTMFLALNGWSLHAPTGGGGLDRGCHRGGRAERGGACRLAASAG